MEADKQDQIKLELADLISRYEISISDLLELVGVDPEDYGRSDPSDFIASMHGILLGQGKR